MHITASMLVNGDESGLHADDERWLEELARHDPLERYQYNRTGEDNGDVHMERQVMGREAVAVTEGPFDVVTWTQTSYGEFGG